MSGISPSRPTRSFRRSACRSFSSACASGDVPGDGGGSRSLTALRADYRERLQQTGATAGRFAPSPKPTPDDLEAWQREVLGSWRGAVSGLAAKIPAWSEAALDRYQLPHPLLGKLTVREMLFFTVYHNAHHLTLVAGRR